MPAARTLALPPLLLALAVAGCGGDDASSGGGSAPQGGPRGGGMFAQLTDEQRSCVEQQGVQVPAGRPGGNGGGTRTAPPAPPADGGTRTMPRDGRGPGGADFEKLRAAMERCGVELPQRPQGGGAPPEGAPQPGATVPQT